MTILQVSCHMSINHLPIGTCNHHFLLVNHHISLVFRHSPWLSFLPRSQFLPSVSSSYNSSITTLSHHSPLSTRLLNCQMSFCTRNFTVRLSLSQSEAHSKIVTVKKETSSASRTSRLQISVPRRTTPWRVCLVPYFRCDVLDIKAEGFHAKPVMGCSAFGH